MIIIIIITMSTMCTCITVMTPINQLLIIIMHVFTNSLLFSILDDTSSPTDFDVRLQALFGPSLVEVYYTNSWLPVCTQDWNRSYGVVVCRQTSYATYITSYSSPTPTNSLHLTGVSCTGRERNLTECNRAGVEAVMKDCSNVIVKCASKLLMVEREEEMYMYMYISVVCCCVQWFCLRTHFVLVLRERPMTNCYFVRCCITDRQTGDP